MKNLTRRLPFVLLIAFELIVGIMLLIEPEIFTQIMVILFGVALIALGVIHLIGYLRNREAGKSAAVSLTMSVILMLSGLLASCFSNAVLKLFAVPVVIYGITLVLIGIYRIGFFFDMKTLGAPMTIIPIITAIVSIVAGAIIAFDPIDTLIVMWRISGIIHILLAFADTVSLLLKPNENTLSKSE